MFSHLSLFARKTLCSSSSRALPRYATATPTGPLAGPRCAGVPARLRRPAPAAVARLRHRRGWSCGGTTTHGGSSGATALAHSAASSCVGPMVVAQWQWWRRSAAHSATREPSPSRIGVVGVGCVAGTAAPTTPALAGAFALTEERSAAAAASLLTRKEAASDPEGSCRRVLSDREELPTLQVQR